MSANASTLISVFGVGKYSHAVNGPVLLFDGTPFRSCGMPDTASPDPKNFTPDRLGMVLCSWHPYPRCIMVGEAIEPKDNAAAINVWKALAAELNIANPLLINVSICISNDSIIVTAILYLV